MKIKLLIFCAMICTSPLFAQKWREMSEDVKSNYYDVKKEGDAYFSTHSTGKGSGYKQFQRWLFYMKNHIDSIGNQINKNQEFRIIEVANKRMSQNKRVKSTGANWTEMGPKYWRNGNSWSPGLGRLEAVRVDGKNQNNIYVGAPGGGAWKTTDGGANWKPLTDFISPSAMFVWSIGLADGSPDSVYVGTQEGILYSYNGGTSFSNASGISGTIRRIEVHPTNHKIILAASTSGIYRSTNAGVSWTLVKGDGAYDLRFKPDNPQVVYACGNEFFKSTDGGLSFANISMGNNGRIKRLAVSAAMPNYVYVAELFDRSFGALYRSTDEGNTFSTRVQGGQNGTMYSGYSIDADDDRGQGGYNFCLAVSPTNAEEVHLGLIITWKSTNGGTSFVASTEWNYPNNTGYTHCDMHQLEYVGNTLYTGSDGGIFKSTNRGEDFTDISTGLGTRMNYHFAQSASDENMVAGAAQDNGCNIYKNNSWSDWLGADGMNILIDWSNSNVVYGMIQFGNLYKTNDAGISMAEVTTPDYPFASHGWVNALCQDTKDPNTLYFGGSVLYKTTDGGINWTNIGNPGAQIQDIEVAPSNNNYVYVGAMSNLFFSSDAGMSFAVGDGISGNINQIAASHTDPKKVYVSTSTGVFMSTNGGANWINITGALPALTVSGICVDDKADEGVYVANTYFVYYKNKNMDWVQFSDKLPLVDIRQLEYQKTAQKVRVCTWGRGIWESPCYNPIETKPVPLFIADVTSGCKKITVKFTNKTIEKTTEVKWYFPGGTPSTSSNKDEVTVTYTGKGLYTVKMVAINNAGKDSLIKFDHISVDEMAAPSSSGVTFCDPGTVTINATKTNGNINWYAENDTLNSIFYGDNYTTNLQQTTNFYINTSNGGPEFHVGPSSTSIGEGLNHLGGQYMIFTAYKVFVLKTVKVKALGSKNRTITLKDYRGNLIDTKTVFIQDGESVVTLNWTIPAGVDMRIGIDQGGADLFRTTTGGVFPYTIENLVSITANSAGSQYIPYFYYFYDWTVQEPATCASNMVKVSAIKNVCVDPTPVPLFTANFTTGCKKIKVKFTNNTTGTMTAVKWSFPGGIPKNSTNKDTVTVIYPGKGLFDVKLVATNNLLKDSLTKFDYISINEIAAPISSGATFCDPGSVTIKATKSDGNINWFAENDTLNSIFYGDNYTTNLQQTTNFYINTTNGGPEFHVGPSSTTIGEGANHLGGQYMIFTAYKAFALKSVKVKALGSKNRTITLKDNTGNLIDTKTVFIQDGESDVTLNWTIPSGVDMRIGIDPGGADLFRTTTGGVFPYTIENLVSITANSAGGQYIPYFYYFYDWKVQEPATCVSNMVKVTAIKNVCTGIIEELENSVIYPNPVNDELHLSIVGEVKATIHTQDGKLVKQVTLEGNTKIIDMRNFPKGIYMLTLEYNNSKNVYKLVK